SRADGGGHGAIGRGGQVRAAVAFGGEHGGFVESHRRETSNHGWLRPFALAAGDENGREFFQGVGRHFRSATHAADSADGGIRQSPGRAVVDQPVVVVQRRAALRFAGTQGESGDRGGRGSGA